ncbi:MAG: HAMP domain-containing histidine kinase [Oligoflexia bacterium]|nr:HAMP domain-containing histidine kinase [Oligoflexia bacterium]
MKPILNQFEKLSTMLMAEGKKEKNKIVIDVDLLSTESLTNEYYNIVTAINHYEKSIEEQSRLSTINKVAQQVAHDIRSPLSALNMIVRLNLQELPEEKRIIVRQQIERIQDIANNLLAKNRSSSLDVSDLKITSVELLSSIIEEIITEKRLNFRSRLGLTIEGDIYNNNSYGLFAKINLTEFKRVISNLINNSVEALPEGQGKIVVILRSPSENVVDIIVEDNGKGIPTEIVDKLGQEGVSFGKEKNNESGSGLGLFHAKTTVEKWGGKFTIDSDLNKGTRMIISLPRETAPCWFVPTISLTAGQAVVILDDDQGIHQTWDNRFCELLLQDKNIEITHLSNPDAFRKWITTNESLYENILYLSDFELLGYKESGLDLLEEYKLKNSILVTSHYENEKIRKRCEKLGVRLIPKMLAGFVPLEMLNSDGISNSHDRSLGSELKIRRPDVKDIAPDNSKMEISTHDIDRYDYVYIDDDEWLRMGWEMVAKTKGIKLLTLNSINDFEKHTSKICKEHTAIYLDRNLGENEMKGDVFAEILYKRGHKNLHLATGEDAENFLHLSWLKVTDKDCPFEARPYNFCAEVGGPQNLKTK